MEEEQQQEDPQAAEVQELKPEQLDASKASQKGQRSSSDLQESFLVPLSLSPSSFSSSPFSFSFFLSSISYILSISDFFSLLLFLIYSSLLPPLSLCSLVPSS